MSDSSRRIWALTAGWVSSKRWAALVKLPSSQMATNVRSRSVGMLVLPVSEVSLPVSDSITSPLRWRPLGTGSLLLTGAIPICDYPWAGATRASPPRVSSSPRPGDFVYELPDLKYQITSVLTHSGAQLFG